MSVDVQGLLTDRSPEDPAGPDLEYDPQFIEMLRLSQGTPERQVGNVVQPAEDPDWPRLRDQCLDLAGRTHDLRVAAWLTLALMQTDGAVGLRDGLAYLAGLIGQHWDRVHPRLDPEDDLDPTTRVNIIGSLAAPAETFGDPVQFIRRLREMPLCRSRQFGAVSLRDLKVAAGEIPFHGKEGAAPPDPAALEAAFDQTDVESLQRTAGALREAVELARTIDRTLTDRVGARHALDLSPLLKELSDARAAVDQRLARRGYGQSEAPPSGQDANTATAPAGQRLSGEINSPQDVIVALDKVCQYYERHEPSSPVPLLVRRAQRLVSKSFLDIVRDLAPESLHQIEQIGGMEKKG